MRNFWLSLGCVVLLALLGWAQYGPGEIYYGGIRLQFSGQVRVAGTCSSPIQLASGVSQIQCQVPEGVAGTIELTATRTPAGAVNIRVESVPSGWPNSLWVQQLGQWVDSRSSAASGWGTITAQYRFTPPVGSAGRQFTLRFKAWTAGVPGELELRVILDVVRSVTPPPTTPPSYGPFTGTTDGTGRFEVPIPTLPNTSVTGQLTECTVKPLPNRQVSVTLVPKTGITTISRADQIGAVRISSPGYGEVEIIELRLLSSMDAYGRTYTAVDVGTVCLRPTGPTQPATPTAPISGKTDSEGKFSVPLPWPGATVSGRLTECTVKPLPNQEFTLTLVPKGETLATPDDIAGFAFNVPSYQEATVTHFSKLSLFGLTAYSVGDVCLLPVGPVIPPPAAPCACSGLNIVDVGKPKVTATLTAIEPMGDKCWVQWDVFVPVTYQISCAGAQPPAVCVGNIAVAVNTNFQGQNPGPNQQKLWTTNLKCVGDCPASSPGPRITQKTVQVKYSFVVEAKQIVGIPFYEDLPFTADINFTLAPQNCQNVGPAVQVPVQIKIGQAAPNPNPPLPPILPPPMILRIDPAIARDPYVAEVERILPVGGGAIVSVRVGNNGTEPSRVRLDVTLVLEDGTTALGTLDDLMLPGDLEFSVLVFVSLPVAPTPGTIWPPLKSLITEIVPYEPDSDPTNNRFEWP
jgi:hypothetical protein